MAAMAQTSAGSSFHALLTGYPVNRSRVGFQTTSGRGRTLARSSLTGTLAGSLRPVRGSAGRLHKLSLRCFSGYGGKPSILPHFSASFFCSISSGRTGMDRFVCCTSEGETIQQSYKWPDNQKPRICILGGGIGGLNTALRLESLVWTDDKKPQIVETYGGGSLKPTILKIVEADLGFYDEGLYYCEERTLSMDAETET